jgi:ribosomal protein S18 acetylase RimI-like enzyme
MPYKLQIADVSRAAEVLSASFMDYPIFAFVIPDGEIRRRRLVHVFRFLVRLALAQGEVLAPSGRIEGVSLWYRSDHARGSVLAAVRAGLVGLYLRAGHGAVSRLIQVSTEKRRVRAKLLAQPYCLLDMIGVDPLLQGQGFARIMIEEKLRELDRERVACYLETSRRETAKYYGRFGFEIVHEYRLATVDVFCLLRKFGAAPDAA